MAVVDPKAVDPKASERRLSITEYLDWLVEDITSVTPLKSILSGSMCRYSMPTRFAIHSVSVSSASGLLGGCWFFHFWSAMIDSGCWAPR